jgi:hypothetical protein
LQDGVVTISFILVIVVLIIAGFSSILFRQICRKRNAATIVPAQGEQLNGDQEQRTNFDNNQVMS